MGYDGFSSTAGRLPQRDLTDRSGGILGDFDLSPLAGLGGRFVETCGR